MGGMDGWLPGMETEQRKPELSQWYTPPMLAEQLWRWANKYQRAQVVCEPAAGRGALVRPILETPHGCKELVVVDIDPDNLPTLNALVHTSRSGIHASVACRDYRAMYAFEHERGRLVFDLTLMNPPYEDGAAEAFIRYAARISHRVVGIFKASILHGVTRYQTLWRECVTTREVRLAARPSFGIGESGGKSGETDFVLLEIRRRPVTVAPWSPQTVEVECWP